jgi:hypothetical protein
MLRPLFTLVNNCSQVVNWSKLLNEDPMTHIMALTNEILESQFFEFHPPPRAFTMAIDNIKYFDRLVFLFCLGLNSRPSTLYPLTQTSWAIQPHTHLRRYDFPSQTSRWTHYEFNIEHIREFNVLRKLLVSPIDWSFGMDSSHRLMS